MGLRYSRVQKVEIEAKEKDEEETPVIQEENQQIKTVEIAFNPFKRSKTPEEMETEFNNVYDHAQNILKSFKTVPCENLTVEITKCLQQNNEMIKCYDVMNNYQRCVIKKLGERSKEAIEMTAATAKGAKKSNARGAACGVASKNKK